MSEVVDIVAMAETFGGPLVDDVLIRHDLADAVFALDPLELLVETRLMEHVAGVATYPLPDEGIRILAVWYDDRQLGMTTMTGLESVSVAWRDDEGTPRAYITETEGDRFVRLWPKPDAPSKPFSFIHGLPYGEDFPVYSVALAYTEGSRLDYPDWLDFPLALAALARHFAREERYRDPTFAAFVRRLAERVLGMVAG